MFFMSFIFMLPIFLLSCMFALAVLVAGLGDVVTIVFELALLFEFSAVVHAAPKTARANNTRIPVARLISVPPRCNIPHIAGASSFVSVGSLTAVSISWQPQ